jgi:hypothetical protein
VVSSTMIGFANAGSALHLAICNSASGLSSVPSGAPVSWDRRQLDQQLPQSLVPAAHCRTAKQTQRQQHKSCNVIPFVWCLLAAAHPQTVCGEAAGAKSGRGKGPEKGPRYAPWRRGERTETGRAARQGDSKPEKAQLTTRLKLSNFKPVPNLIVFAGPCPRKGQ